MPLMGTVVLDEGNRSAAVLEATFVVRAEKQTD
jgi:hypothetical protein